ncbi:MAG: hypothetical protein HY954_06205 [Deltaproteobacteria bacterium]|nr:hypothetical protein [Deltaproteobacteria bacterium]
MKKLSAFIPALLIFLWVIGAAGVFKAEFFSFRLIPGLLNMSSEERASFAGGPAYSLFSKAVSTIPQDKKVYFLIPAGQKNGYLPGKARYYLYPRKVAAVTLEEFNGADKDDYIMLVAPVGEIDTGRLPDEAYIEKVFDHTDEKFRAVLYRVVKGNG